MNIYYDAYSLCRCLSLWITRSQELPTIISSMAAIICHFTEYTLELPQYKPIHI